jgi:hypothetical protein
MLDRCDRVQVAVADRHRAAEGYRRLFGAETVREDVSRHLGARRLVLALGESEIELCEPDGAGRTQAFISAWGESIMTAGYATVDVERLARRLEQLDVAVTREDGQLYFGPPDTPGVPFVISPSTYRERVGRASFLYETTNTLVTDWRRAAAIYAGLFGLEPSRFCRIGSHRFAYEGTLTLFDPPNRLDRIELSQVTGGESAMGRFVARRGDSLYMAYVEVHDWPGIHAALMASGARWTPRGKDASTEKDGGWIHPRELGGLLLGVSRTTLAWEWSGRKELVTTAP